MNEVMEFLGQAPAAFATLKEDKPRVRFLGFKMEDNGNLYFLTDKRKNVYQELVKNNNVEICSFPNKDNHWIRIEGKVEFVEDVELNKKAFSILPILEQAYKSPDNENIVLLKIIDMNIRKYSMKGEEGTLSFN
ncbi:MAG: pyridoxamine 5'-phosphate oxidase family protein [Tissierellia bacterium]|nr:pyridoxamine 5'-phosphate oxidase family protein [Tissierellia bacterium]